MHKSKTPKPTESFRIFHVNISRGMRMGIEFRYALCLVEIGQFSPQIFPMTSKFLLGKDIHVGDLVMVATDFWRDTIIDN